MAVVPSFTSSALIDPNFALLLGAQLDGKSTGILILIPGNHLRASKKHLWKIVINARAHLHTTSRLRLRFPLARKINSQILYGQLIFANFS